MASSEREDVSAKKQKPLCVDLDGSLLRSDLLFESFLLAFKRNPIILFLIPIWLFRGRNILKLELAARVNMQYGILPYNEELLSFIKAERSAGRLCYLVSASASSLVEGVANYLRCFDGAYGSDRSRNLKGKHKQSFLIEMFETEGYDYVGDCSADLPIWQSASKSYLVTDGTQVRNSIEKGMEFQQVFRTMKPTVQTYFRAIRVHQWVKNLLLFVPPIMAHSSLSGTLLRDVLVAFFVFSFCASAVYLLNDLVDLDADRVHPSKSKRPLAAGDIPISHGLILSPLMFCSAVVASFWFLPAKFMFILLAYIVLTTLYSFYLKSIAIVDIVLLASLYTVRVLAGGAAVAVPVSEWLLGFSMFIFLSLACVKRYAELLTLTKSNREVIHGRGYRRGDEQVIGWLGTSSGYLSVLVLALYINSEQVVALYGHSEYLWFVCPVVLFWISRIWLLVHREELHEDPIVFALRDSVSYVAGLIAALIIIFAT